MTKKSSAQIRREVVSFLSAAQPPSDSSEEGILAMTILPAGKNPGIGAESGSAKRNGIGVHRSPHGSTRYLYYVDGKIESGMQVVSGDGKLATIANVFTTKAQRGRGLAAALLARARKDFDVVRHASDESTTAAGRGWKHKHA